MGMKVNWPLIILVDNRVAHTIEDFSKWQISTRSVENEGIMGGPIQGTIT